MRLPEKLSRFIRNLELAAIPATFLSAIDRATNYNRKSTRLMNA